MGALPKRRISKARKNRRRSHDALTPPALAKCPKCGKMKRPHFRCEFCGYYGGKPTTTTTKPKSTRPEATPKKVATKKK